MLQIIGSTQYGGVQTFVMNMFREIVKYGYVFDFYISDSNPGVFDTEIESLGGRIFHAEPIAYSNKLLQLIGSNRVMRSFFKQHPEYKVVHVHTNSAVDVLFLVAAKSADVPVRIIHSHSTNTKNIRTHEFFQPLISFFATEKLACSETAGIWMYGKRFDRKSIFSNAIDLYAFAFCEKTRNQYKRLLGIEGKTIIGHVGRFAEVKNHRFLLDIFKNYLLINPNSVLICVGSGEMLERTHDYASRLGIGESVLLLGDRNDVKQLLNVFDVFVLPSFHEGVPIVLIEAQANGIPIVVSDTVSIECSMSELTTFSDLDLGSDKWSKEICNSIDRFKDRDRRVYAKALQGGKYDIRKQIERLLFLYKKSE